MPQLLAGARLLGLTLPAAEGGRGATQTQTGLICEVLGAADAAAPLLVIQAGTVSRLLTGHADPALAARWVPAILAGQAVTAMAFTEEQSGSDLSDLRTRACRVPGGWRLTGRKVSVAQCEASALVVLAASDDGPRLLFVEAAAPGLRRTRTPSLGLRAAGRCTIDFDGVLVPAAGAIGAAGDGVRTALRDLAASRLMVCLSLVGVARGALAEVLAGAGADGQDAAFTLADCFTELELSRLLCLHGLRLADEGRDFRLASAMAKARVPRAMAAVCRECLVLQGERAGTIELRWRDVIGYELGEGPENVQRLILSRLLLGCRPG